MYCILICLAEMNATNLSSKMGCADKVDYNVPETEYFKGEHGNAEFFVFESAAGGSAKKYAAHGFRRHVFFVSHGKCG